MKRLFWFLCFIGIVSNGFAQYYNDINDLPQREAEKYLYKYSEPASQKKLFMNEDVLWVDSSFVCIKADKESNVSNYFVGSLPLMIDGKVTKNPTPLAKTISNCLLDKEFCEYISSLGIKDVTQVSCFWVHIKGELDRYVNNDRFGMPSFVGFDMRTIRYREKIGDYFCFFVQTEDSWGIIWYKDYWRMVTTYANAYGHRLKERDYAIIDGWFDMLPFPKFPEDIKQKAIKAIKDNPWERSLFYY